MSDEMWGVTTDELRELCRAYIQSDSWGRQLTMNMVRSQAAKNPASKSAGPLRLVRTSHLDQRAHLIDNVVNSFSLTLVRQAVNGK